MYMPTSELTKIIFEYDGDKNASCTFKSGRKNVKWQQLSKDDKIAFLNTIANFYGLFYADYIRQYENNIRDNRL